MPKNPASIFFRAVKTALGKPSSKVEPAVAAVSTISGRGEEDGVIRVNEMVEDLSGNVREGYVDGNETDNSRVPEEAAGGGGGGKALLRVTELEDPREEWVVLSGEGARGEEA